MKTIIDADKNKLFIRSSLKNFLILIFLIGIIIVFSITIKGFWALQNFQNMSRQIAVLGVLSVGMTLAIISGGIDLSVGAIMAFSISIGGMGIERGLPIYIVYIMIIISGLFLGVINGYLVSKITVPAIIITLATMNVFRGITMVMTNGIWVSPIPESYLHVGKGYIPIIILMITVFALMVLTTFTKFGRNIFAIGGNEIASKFSGVPVNRYKIYIYMTIGFLCAIAGIIFVGRSGFIQPQVGIGYEMNAIAAVVIGGTNIYGGSGSVFRSLIGTIIIGIILVGLTMIGIDPYWQGAITGSIIILAILIDSIRNI